VALAASQPVTQVAFEVPPGACDCHTHIHGDTARFPYFAGRTYTPPAAMPQEMAALHKALGIQRVIIVTPSIYGTDNAATLWGMQAYGAGARGVAVIDERTTEAELDSLGRAGFCGIRINLATLGVSDPGAARERFQAAVKRIAARGWHLQLFASLAVSAALADLVAASPVPVVFDHFGGALADGGLAQPGFSALVSVVRSGKAWVKISYAGRPCSDFSGFAPLAHALVEANPDRILWGTNWPHPDSRGGNPAAVSPFFEIDDGLVLNQLPQWVPDPALRKRILVDNPANLYGF
jgi:predicted TIM-barrel fold metal-dependent hydrolase